MKQVGLLVRIVLLAAGLAAIAWLGLKLRDKWAEEAKQKAQPAAEADAGGPAN